MLSVMLSMFCRSDSNGIHLFITSEIILRMCTVRRFSSFPRASPVLFSFISCRLLLPPPVILILAPSGLCFRFFPPIFIFSSYLFIQSFPFSLCITFVQYFVDFLFTPPAFLYFYPYIYPSIPPEGHVQNALLSGTRILSVVQFRRTRKYFRHR